MVVARRAHRRPTLPIRARRFFVGTGVAAGLFLFASLWLHDLAFDRAQVFAGEYWRLATSHLTHLDTKHALVNALGVGLVTAMLLEFVRLRTIIASSAALAGTISLVSIALCVDVGYAGFSGVLHGLAAMAAFALWNRAPWLAATVAVLLVAGIATALAGWSRPWTADVAIHTHVSGVAVGIALGVWLRRRA